MKRNVPILGLILGLILPVLGFFIVYLILFPHTSFHYFFNTVKSSHSIASKVLSLGLLINLVPFIFYTSRRLDLTARGILVATVLYFVFIILLKFVW